MPTKTTKPLNLQKALDELEKITQSLERADGDVEASIAEFERGLELANAIKERLTEVENKIVQIKKKHDKK